MFFFKDLILDPIIKVLNKFNQCALSFSNTVKMTWHKYYKSCQFILIVVSIIAGLYQAVHKLPAPLEWVLNTPSHHRVHHGSNRYCIDKNYAGVLIIWDKLFGE